MTLQLSAVSHPTLPLYAPSYMSKEFEISVRSAFQITLLNCCSIHPHTRTHVRTHAHKN